MFDAKVPGRVITSLIMIFSIHTPPSQTWTSKAQTNMCYSTTVLSDFGGKVLQLKCNKSVLLWEYPYSRLLVLAMEFPQEPQVRVAVCLCHLPISTFPWHLFQGEILNLTGFIATITKHTSNTYKEPDFKISWTQ